MRYMQGIVRIQFFRGVGQVVDRYIWDVDVASSSLVTPIQPYLAEVHS